MILTARSDIDNIWDSKRWPNFSPIEVSCRHCNEYYHDSRALDCLQRMRDMAGKPLRINSGHRCKHHNDFVGGGKNSQHLKIAFDVGMSNHHFFRTKIIAKASGFTGIGLYQTFIHVDLGPEREWFGDLSSVSLWQ